MTKNSCQMDRCRGWLYSMQNSNGEIRERYNKKKLTISFEEAFMMGSCICMNSTYLK